MWLVSRRIKNLISQIGLFSGVVHYMDCGSIHHYRHQGGNRYNSYYCRAAAKRIKTCPSRHYIREKDLYDYILKEFKHLMGLLKSHEKELVAYLENKQKISDRHQLNHKQQSLQKAEARDKEIDHVIERLYEDNLSGKVSDERYAKLVGHYESEQKELKDQIEVLKSSVVKSEAESSGIKGHL